MKVSRKTMFLLKLMNLTNLTKYPKSLLTVHQVGSAFTSKGVRLTCATLKTREGAFTRGIGIAPYMTKYDKISSIFSTIKDQRETCKRTAAYASLPDITEIAHILWARISTANEQVTWTRAEEGSICGV